MSDLRSPSFTGSPQEQPGRLTGQGHRGFGRAGSLAGLHWYDFICPFCYVGQQRTALLVERGLRIAELPFEAHPEIPPGGIAAGPRLGPIYALIRREADQAGLPLHWPSRLPNTRLALATAEWVRRHRPSAFPSLRRALFHAHFAGGEDLGDPHVIDRHLSLAGVGRAAVRDSLVDGSAWAAIRDAERLGRANGVNGTPAWLVEGRLISGLRPAGEFENIALHDTAGSP